MLFGVSSGGKRAEEPQLVVNIYFLLPLWRDAWVYLEEICLCL